MFEKHWTEKKIFLEGLEVKKIDCWFTEAEKILVLN